MCPAITLAGLYKLGKASAAPEPPKPPTPEPPKPKEEPPKTQPKGPLMGVPGVSTTDGCPPGCGLCLLKDNKPTTTCLACSDIQAFSNINGTCVCGIGRGGSDCGACEKGSFSMGGTPMDPNPTCRRCRPGFTTRGPGAFDPNECLREYRACLLWGPRGV